MNLTEEQFLHLKDFFSKSEFSEKGGVITDFDGTAIHEYQWKIYRAESCGIGVEKNL
ncbi:MAG: hypothetical protein WKG06_20845 [Segetibacter sp.]